MIKFKLIVKDAVRKLIGANLYSVIKGLYYLRSTSMDSVFRLILKRNHTINTIIDVGASDGRWSDSLMRYFPKCIYFLIEAQPVHKRALAKFSRKHNNVQFILAAAGECRGFLNFDATDPFAGQASNVPFILDNIQVPVISIDEEVESRNLPAPYLLKLDTHGYEVPILKGAFKTLEKTEIIIMECYNFKISPDCLLFFEMCDYLWRLGFRCINLADPINRPQDGAFWQMDLVFVRQDRIEFTH